MPVANMSIPNVGDNWFACAAIKEREFSVLSHMPIEHIKKAVEEFVFVLYRFHEFTPYPFFFLSITEKIFGFKKEYKKQEMGRYGKRPISC